MRGLLRSQSLVWEFRYRYEELEKALKFEGNT